MAGFTKAELVAAARAAGHDRVSARLVDDWVGLGLLDRPTRHPAGYGKGSEPGTWSANQRELFLALLRHRDDAGSVAALCNLPVWLWLWWGDDFVPLRQARRAQATWAAAVREPPRGRSARSVGQLVADWGEPGAGRAARRELVEALHPMVCAGRIDEAALLPKLRAVFDPEGRGLAAEGYLRLLRARVEALRRLTVPADRRFERGKRAEPIDDALLEWARFFYLATRQSYAAEQPRLATDQRFGGNFDDTGLDAVVGSSCLDLATVLGLGLTTPLGAPPGTLLDPAMWREGKLRTTLATSVEGGQLHVRGRTEPKTDHGRTF
jgi:hypothetical protein